MEYCRILIFFNRGIQNSLNLSNRISLNLPVTTFAFFSPLPRYCLDKSTSPWTDWFLVNDQLQGRSGSKEGLKEVQGLNLDLILGIAGVIFVLVVAGKNFFDISIHVILSVQPLQKHFNYIIYLSFLRFDRHLHIKEK